jgi:TPR repeat protein
VDKGTIAYNKGDYNTAIKIFSKECKDGQPNACYNLAIMYENGEGVKQDESKIKELFKRTCDLGFDLGCMNYEAIK